MLDEAAREFNARGISGADVAKIAERVGLSRAALYYYFENREQLAFRCYLRSCETMAADLAAAAAAPSGLERVLAAVRRVLDPGRAPTVVLSEIPFLSTGRRVAVEKAHAENVGRLRRFVDDGIRDGSVRPCETEIVTQAIVGVLSWMPLSPGWVEGAGEALRTRSKRAVAELIAEGVAADPERPLSCPLDVSAFGPKHGSAFDPRESKALKVEQLTRTASWLFNRHGIDGTSLDNVTASLGATKGAFYHYIANKDELVVRCYRRAYTLYERFAEAAEEAGGNGLERGLFGLHLNVQAHVAGLSPLAPLTGVGALPKKARTELRRRSRELERRFERFGRQGIADGTLRPYDVQSIAIAGAGAFAWIPKWLPENDPRSARFVADEIVTLFARGLRQ